MKNKNTIAMMILLALIIAAVNYMHLSASAATDEIIIRIKLAEVVEVSGENDDSLKSALGSAIQMATQPAVDALYMDHPETAIWHDVASSRFSYSYMLRTDSDGFMHANVQEMDVFIGSLAVVYDPDGMVGAVRTVISSFAPSGSTRYDVLKSIHDFVCSSAVYDGSGSFAHHAFGALIDGKAVCQGYSEAFKLLCDAYGIPCVLVTGTGVTNTGSEEHMWCKVLMDDGKWYNVDVTWDDQKNGTIKYDYFLIGDNTKINKKSFVATHIEDGDLSNSGLFNFEYPNASPDKYIKNGSSSDSSGTDTSWFYSQLNDNQKRVYDGMLSAEPPVGSPRFIYSPQITTESESQEQTAPPITDPPISESTVPDTVHNTLSETSTEIAETTRDIPDTSRELTSWTTPVSVETSELTIDSDAESIENSESESDSIKTGRTDIVGLGETSDFKTDQTSADKEDFYTSKLDSDKNITCSSSSVSQETGSASVSETISVETNSLNFKRVIHVIIIVASIIIVFTVVTFVIIRVGKSDRALR